jgi:hypothetical protein
MDAFGFFFNALVPYGADIDVGVNLVINFR